METPYGNPTCGLSTTYTRHPPLFKKRIGSGASQGMACHPFEAEEPPATLPREEGP